MKKRYRYSLTFIAVFVAIYYVGMHIMQVFADNTKTTGAVDAILTGIAYAFYFIGAYLVLATFTSFALYVRGRIKGNTEMKKAFGFTSILFILMWIYIVIYIIDNRQ